MKKVFLLVFCCCNLSAMTPLVPGEDMGQPLVATLIQLLFGYEMAVCFANEEQQVESTKASRSHGGYGTMNQGISMVRSVEPRKKETTAVQTEDITQ
jgi:hypothetical protein